MLRSDKERIVAELAEKLRATPTLFVADYRGLSVTEIDELRTKLIEHGARFTVVKNTLTKRAAEEAGAEALLALLDGPTAIAFIESDGDMVAVAKALTESARETQILAIRGGILDVFGATEERAVRIELFGDEVESMRWFSTFTQRSLGDAERVELAPGARATVVSATRTPAFAEATGPLIVPMAAESYRPVPIARLSGANRSGGVVSTRT